MFTASDAFQRTVLPTAHVGTVSTSVYTLGANASGVFTLGLFNFISLFDGLVTLTAVVQFVQPNGSISGIQGDLPNVTFDCVSGGLEVVNNSSRAIELVIRGI